MGLLALLFLYKRLISPHGSGKCNIAEALPGSWGERTPLWLVFTNF